MRGELSDFALKLRRWNCRGFEMRWCAVIRPVRHKIKLAIHHGAMTREHDNREVLTRTPRHIALHRGEGLENAGLVRGGVATTGA